MSSRERVGGGERDREAGPAYRSGYVARGGGGNFRGRGAPGYKPRRYWDNDEYYKEDRERGGRRRRRSYSRSRSRSYSSRSRSRSRSPPPRRGRSRSPRPPEEYVPQPAVPGVPPPHGLNRTPEPYVPSSDPANSWTGSTLSMTLPQANGRSSSMNQMNPYANADTVPSYHAPPVVPQYQENQGPLSTNNQAAMSYGYTRNVAAPVPVAPYQRPPHAPEVMYPAPAALGLTASIPPPPVITESKPIHESSEGSNKKSKKDKRKKKKRHHSSSSSSSSSDDSSGSRRRSKSKKDQRNSDSSSEEDKKESGSGSGAPSSVLTSQQKEALGKQRDGYRAKLDILEREIAKLRSKEDELVRSRADRQLIEENLKLQAELKGRCKAVMIVLEKIDDVFKDGSKPTPAVQEKPKPVAIPPVVPIVPAPPIQKQPSFESKGFSIAGSKSGVTAFEYFDNKRHWCRLCNVFPESVEDMLSHFHGKEHHDQIQQLGIDEKPWHKRNAASDSKHMSGAKKAPFRGMQFFSPVQGWYCRLCNSWMGDPHCAVEHLKSDEHNSNYMNFLDEHPDWEKKWVSDREKALTVSGTDDPSLSSHSTARKSRFDDGRPPPQPERSERKPVIQEDMESGKSIRVQMRNSLKSEEKDHESQQYAAAPPPAGDAKLNKDSGLEEWMAKPKIPVDIIDTQKFAAIVRQKHGAKEKEIIRDTKHDVLEVKLVPAAPVISSKDGRDPRKDDRRRPDKVELQISSREKDRDIRERYNRDRERDSRAPRRRSRSRSRSRDRTDRRYNNRRRSRSRSRSRSRERERPSDRDRGDNRRDNNRTERERPEVKEAVKKLPMIGKMPLYKRPVFTKEKREPEVTKDLIPDIIPPTAVVAPVSFLQRDRFVQQQHQHHHHQKEESRVPMFSENSTSNPPFGYEAPSAYGQNSSAGVGEYGTIPSVASSAQFGSSLRGEPTTAVAAVQEESPPSSGDLPHHIMEVNESLVAASVDVKEKEGGPPGALPDDFQQALDIIYAANMHPKSGLSVPQPVPPPASIGAGANSSDPVSGKPPAGGDVNEYGSSTNEYDRNGYCSNYMGYEPYQQQSFDGYAPYEELDDGPPGVGEDPPPGTVAVAMKPPPVMVEQHPQDKVVDKDPPPPGDDDMDDLRMLGIDVDDTAVVKH